MAELKPVYVDPQNPGRLYEPKENDSFINEPEITVDTLDDLRALDLDKSVRTIKARTLGHSSVLDGGGGPPFHFDSISQAIINNTGGYATGNGISISVQPLPETILAGQVLEFENGGIFTLTSDAKKGEIVISGDLTGSSVSDGEKSWLEDNNGTVIKPTYTGFDGEGRWKRIYKGAALVEWYGAVDDASTDSTTAFQNAVKNNKKISTKLSGTFLLSSRITLSHDDAVIDLGQCECRIDDNVDIDLFFVTGDRSGVINGRIDGNKANQPGTTNRAMVQLQDASDQFAKNIYIKDPDGYGIRARNSPRALIKDNTVINSDYYAIYTISPVSDIEGASIINNYVDRRDLGPLSAADGGGIVIHSDTGTPTTDTYRQSGGRVVNNTVYLDEGSSANECFIVGGNKYSFTNNYGFGGSIGVTLYGEYCTCGDNVFEDNNNWGIEYTHSFKLSITGNIVKGNNNTQNGISQNADISGRSEHITISGNVVERCTQANYWVRYSDHTSITGNACIAGRMLLEGCEGLSLCGNIWDDDGVSLAACVSARDQENFTFVGNFLDTPNTNVAIDLISSDGGFVPDRVIVQGNYIDISAANPIIKSNLASGAIGDNWVVKSNRGSSPFDLESLDHIYFKADNSVNVVFGHIAGDPSSLGLGNRGIGSLAIDRTNGVLYIKTGASSVDWTVVGSQT